VAAVRHTPEWDGEEERDDRERGGDEPDLERAVAEGEQPVRRRRPRDVDRGLRGRRREQREGESAAQRSRRLDPDESSALGPGSQTEARQSRAS
jgi:hypothetical protein